MAESSVNCVLAVLGDIRVCLVLVTVSRVIFLIFHKLGVCVHCFQLPTSSPAPAANRTLMSAPWNTRMLFSSK